MIKTVIYDLDDTLYDFASTNRIAFQNLCEEASRRFDMPAEQFAEMFNTSYRAIREYMPSDIRSLCEENLDFAPVHSRTLRTAYTLEQLGLPLFPHVTELYDVYWNTILDLMQPEPGIVEAMQGLKEKGIRIGIGSNMTSRMQFLKIERLGLGAYLDFVTVSEESIFDKPDPRFFARVLLKAKAQPEECLFIGDNYHFDYEGALACGMQALWYTAKEKPWNHVTEEQRTQANKLQHHLDVLNYPGI